MLKLEADGQTFRLGGMASRTGFLDEEMLQIDVPPRREFLARLAAAPDGCTEVRSPEESIIAEWLHERWRAGGYLAAALCRGNDTIGILVVGSDAGGTFSATATRRLVVGMARQTALALDNARLREQAEAASALKSQFISMMSHELRSPMHAIIGYTAMLTEESDDLSGGAAETRREMLERVRIQSCQLLEIIEASLDVNRLEAGRISVTRTPIALDSLFEQMVASVPEYWLKPDVHLVWDVQPLPTVETDGPKVKLIVFKLVQNALKFTDHGEVRIAVWADDTTPGADADGILRITVSDTGIGMAPELVPRMFDMFRQGDGSFTRRHGGVGLGLYIVRRLVELLDGTIDVVSVPGEGTRFAVSMPFHTPIDRPAPALTLGAAPPTVPLLH